MGLGLPHLHPTPYTLQPAPHTLHPAPCTLHPAPYTLHTTTHTLHHTPCTLHPAHHNPHPTPYTVQPAPLGLGLSRLAERCLAPFMPALPPRPGVELMANVESISYRCFLRQVAFVWELTQKNIHLQPLGCLQGRLNARMV